MEVYLPSVENMDDLKASLLKKLGETQPMAVKTLMACRWSLSEGKLILRVPKKNIPFLKMRGAFDIVKRSMAEEGLGEWELVIEETDESLTPAPEKKNEENQTETASEEAASRFSAPSAPAQLIEEDGASPFDRPSAIEAAKKTTRPKRVIEGEEPEEGDGENGAPEAAKKAHNCILVGKPITGRERPLEQCDEEVKSLIVRGIISSFDTRPIHEDKMLLTFTLTNYAAEVKVKVFVMKKAYHSKMEDKLVKGATVLVKGSLMMSTFSHELELMANHVTVCAEPLYVDEAKKAELESMILGRPIHLPISRINEALNGRYGVPLAIEGEILELDTKETRGGRTLMTAQVTDYTASITVKAFVNPEVLETKADALKNGKQLLIKGVVEEDDFTHEPTLTASSIAPHKAKLKPSRKDTAERKRIELHAHTQMSEMDATVAPKDLVNQAYEWGMPAIAITDHGVAQGFPEAMDAVEKIRGEAEKNGQECSFKAIYGCEAYLVDDLQPSCWHYDLDMDFDREFVVFDIETTGLNEEKDTVIEIGAVKIKDGRNVDSFSRFINPGRILPPRIVQLTGISDADLADAEPIDKVLPEFLQWVGGAVMVAHNASFDTGFIARKAKQLGLGPVKNAVVDTLMLARGLYELKNFRLDTVCKHLNISLVGHHRAVNDAAATGEIFIKELEALAEKGVKSFDEANEYVTAHLDKAQLKSYHAVILVKNLVGLRNLYELISVAHLNYFNRTPRLPKSEFNRLREGLIISSGCQEGELYQAIIEGKDEATLSGIASYYDYLEIQPIGNNFFLTKEEDWPFISNEEDIREMNRLVLRVGDELKLPVVATGDVHFKEPEDSIYRSIIMAGKGFKDADDQAPLYFRTTDDMLREFAYFGDRAEELVIDNPLKIADQIEYFLPIPKGQFSPKIEGAEEELRKTIFDKAESMYGSPLPEIVSSRLEREADSIIKYGFATLYILARRLVLHSVGDGYYVGSRGSVGSSLVATMADITEVNPLPAHYYCPVCKYSDFDSEIIRANAGASGFDLPDQNCPICGRKMKKDGQDIPFEVFLGFKGDKEPDIDLNFSGEYQPRAHAYVEEMFGKEQVYRAGTTSALAEKTAYGYVKKYLEERNIKATEARVAFLVHGVSGVKKTTGQHPGGQLVVPKGYSIYQFCPVQHPANDASSGTITSHFDYNQLHGRLLKLDILGHDDPTMVRMLEDLTGFKATNAPLDDPEVMSLFLNTDALGVKPEDIDSPVGTFGIPEFGTQFVRGMLVETKPQNFSDLVRISGLSHGTDVWNNNAQVLVQSGTVKMSQCICTREDIMNGLIRRGLEKSHAFRIMETVRKGKKSGGLKPDDVAAMKAIGVEDWYLDSCKKIQYLFPKAHAVAYVTMSLRVAYYKVHFKEAYYAAYFTIRADAFDYLCMCRGLDVARKTLAEIDAKDRNEKTAKDKERATILQLVIEFYCRGLEFLPIDLNKSDSRKFKIEDGKLRPPFNSIPGMGDAAADSIVEARKDGEFFTQQDFIARTKVNRSIVDVMRDMGIMDGLSETDQLSLF